MSIGTMLFNPFNGKPRRPEDIGSDPKGILVWDGLEELIASPKRTHVTRNVRHPDRDGTMKPLTAAMYMLHPGDRTWIESSLDEYHTVLSRVTLKSRYHRCIKGRTFSGSVYVAVRGTETVVLVCVTRLT